MRKITFLFALLFLMFCAWGNAQTSEQNVYLMSGTKATTLSEGIYVVEAFSSEGRGLVYHEAGLTDRPVRYTVGKAVEDGELIKGEYVWTLTMDNSGLVTLQNNSTGRYFSADADKNKNMSATDAASLTVEEHTIDGTAYFTLKLNETAGWIHANHASGIDPNLSYWPGYGDDGTCVKFTFYPVTVPTSLATVTFNYKSWEENTVFASETEYFLPGRALNVSSVPELDFYTNYAIADNLTTSEGSQQVDVTCDPAFPFTSGNMYLMKIYNNQYLNRISDNETTTGATKSAAVAAGGFYIPEHVPNTALFTFRHVATGKYLTMSSATNQTVPTYEETVTTWTEGTDATSYFRVTKNGVGFNVQHPGNALANMGNHISGNLGFWTHTSSPSGDGSRWLVGEDIATALQEYAEELGVGSHEEWVSASQALKDAVAVAMANPTMENVAAYVAVPETPFADCVEEGRIYQIIFDRGEVEVGNYSAVADAQGTVSTSADARAVTTKLPDDMDNSARLSALWGFEKADDGKVYMKNVNSGFYVGDVDGGNLVTTKEKVWGKAYTFEGGSNGLWVVKNEAVTGDDNYLNSYYNPGQNSNMGICYYNGGFSDDGNILMVKRVEEITVSLNSAEGASYATLCLPFPVQIKEGDATKAYTVARVEGESYVRVTAIEDGIIPANTGVLLKNDNAASEAVFTVLQSTEKEITNNILEGASVKRTGITQTDYLIFGYTAATGVGFYQPNTTELKSNRAYIPNPSDSQVTALSIRFDEDATGIEAVAGDAVDKEAIYDLCGRRVVNPVKGIYIRGGKKICIQ